jgi:hypothetical protein
VRRAHVRNPVTHSFIDRVLQRAAAGIHTNHFRAEETHAKNIQPLAFHILGAHINRTSEAESRGDRSCGHSMLPCAGFRDDSFFAHAHSE